MIYTHRSRTNDSEISDHPGRSIAHLARRLVWMGLAASFLLVFVSPCIAQDSEYRVEGYLFAAPGLRTHEQEVSGIAHVGGGFGVSVFKGLAAEAEIGYLRPWKETYEDLGMISLSGNYRLPKRGKLVPFFFAGVSLALRDRTLALHEDTPSNIAETLTLLNFGLGGTYWFKPRKGLRFEIRDHLYTAEKDRQYLEFRLGFSFR